MPSHRAPPARIVLVVLCCLVPLAALASCVFLNTPTGWTGIVALAILLPIGLKLLSEL